VAIVRRADARVAAADEHRRHVELAPDPHHCAAQLRARSVERAGLAGIDEA
jgi:hypothetical protein